jgi:TonB-linked SusC/RagA family outer membrane protein
MRHQKFATVALPAIALLAALTAARPASAQGTATVRGTVTDSTSRQPVQGAQIIVVGQTARAISGENGQYTLRNVDPGSITIRSQIIGFAPTEQRATVAAGQDNVVDLVLSRRAVQLSEVVVSVGYGTETRRNVSNAVTNVQAAEIMNAPLAGVDAALQGKAPGLQVVQNSGNPGVGITVRVRGAASLSASNQPLYVIDGVPMVREDFSQLDVGGQDVTSVTGVSPDEIESVDVLKDAAAAAIYGSRGSNGVVMITTKRGRAGRPRFSFNAYTGTQEAVKTMPMVNAKEYVEYMNEARTNDGREPRFTPGVDDTINTDWQNSVLRTAPVNDVFLSIDGGSDRVRYLIGGSYFNQKGIVIGSGYDRQTGRANVDFNATDRLSFRTSISLSREDHDRIENDNTIEGVFANAIANQPIFPVQQPDGRYTSPDDQIGNPAQGLGYVNPVAVGKFSSVESRVLRALGNVEGTFAFTDHLQLTSRAGLDVLNVRDLRWNSPLVAGSYAAGAGGQAQQGNNTANRYVLESFLGYNRGIGQAQLSLTGGASVEYNESELDFIQGEGFASNEFRYVGTAGRVAAYDGDKTGNNLVSVFSRANLTFRDRYLLTASLRTDGSSRFGENNRYGVFPAVSLGWILTEESFMPQLPGLSEFKLRASYGETGNQGIPDDDFASLGRFGKANYADEPGLGPSALENPDLRWETTREFDAGFDLSFFSGRVALIGDYYVKKTDDLLVERPISRTSGFEDIWDNVGNIENRGFELGLNTINIEPRFEDGFRWTSDFNIAWNRNRVTELFGDQPFNSGIDGINRIQEGQPLGAFQTLKFLGVDPQTGDALYEDADGDGTAGNSGDRVIVGSPHPKYFGGFNNVLSWRGFDLRAFLQFTQGHQVFNGIRQFADDGGLNRDNKFQDVMRRWRQPGDITDQPRASSRCESNGCLTSSRMIEDGSYVRLQDVTLGYTLPTSMARGARFQNVRLFVSGRNLQTWTDYSGFNPEANSNGSSANTSLGNEFYSYPLARTIMFGVTGAW